MKFKFIDFEKMKFKFIDFEKAKFKFRRIREWIQIQNSIQPYSRLVKASLATWPSGSARNFYVLCKHIGFDVYQLASDWKRASSLYQLPITAD